MGELDRTPHFESLISQNQQNVLRSSGKLQVGAEEFDRMIKNVRTSVGRENTAALIRIKLYEGVQVDPENTQHQ